jgi:hypothetical protein
VLVGRNVPGQLSGAAMDAGAGASFLLECRYSQAGSQMEIFLDWRDRRAGTRLASAKRRGRVDLVLDSLILQALDELLAQLRGRIEERPVQVSGVQTASVRQAAPVAPPESAAQVAPAVAVSSVLKPGPGDSPSSTSAVPAGEPVTRGQPAAGSSRFVLSPTVAPFVALGAASYYFPVGIQSLVQGNFPLAAGRGRLGLGVLLGVTVFTAQGSMERSLNFLVPLGASLNYALEIGRRWNLLFQLGAGPALLVMSMESQEPLVKPLAYLRSGLGAELALARHLGLALEAAYEVYFEEPYLIMGFTPGLSLRWRM